MSKEREVKSKTNNNCQTKDLFYFDFWPVCCVVVAGTASVGFFDFITIATMRCSSIRKARTILK